MANYLPDTEEAQRVKLGKALEAMRNALGLESRQVSDRLNIHRGTLSGIESGKRHLAEHHALDILQFYAREYRRQGVPRVEMTFGGDSLNITPFWLYQMVGIEAPTWVQELSVSPVVDSWQQNIEAGTSLHLLGKWDDAIAYFKNAVATSKMEEQKSLAFASLGLLHRDQNNLKLAEEYVGRSLVALALPGRDLGTKPYTIQDLSKHIQEQVGWDAFAVAVRTMGQIYSSREQFDNAVNAYETLGNISSMVTDTRTVRSQSLHHLGTSAIEAGTSVNDLDKWRTVENTVSIEQGIVAICESLRNRDAGDGVGMGHDHHQLAKAYALLGNFSESQKEMDRAAHYYGDSIASINNIIDAAHLAMGKEEHKEAMRLHEQTLQRAEDINSAHHVSRTYTGMTVSLSQIEQFEEAKRMSLSAMWRWPFELYANDFTLPLELFLALGGSQRDLNQSVSPVHIERTQEILAEIERGLRIAHRK